MFFYSLFFNKSPDLFVWAMMPVYLFLLVRAIEVEKTNLIKTLSPVAVVAALIVFWYGGVYIAAGYGVSVLAYRRRELKKMLIMAAAAGAVCLGVMYIVRYGIFICAGGDWFTHVVRVFRLFSIPWQHYYPTFDGMFGGFFRFLPFKDIYPDRYRGLLLVVQDICIAGLMIYCAVRAIRTSAVDAGLKRLAGIAGIHCLFLFLLLLYMSAFYSNNTELTMLMQANRYMHHLAPGIAIVWITPAAGATRKSDAVAARGKSAVLRFAPVAILLAVAAAAMAGRVSGEFSEMAKSAPAEDGPEYLIQRHLRSSGIKNYKIFDEAGDTQKPLLPEVINNYFPVCYDEKTLEKTYNTKPVYIYVIVRRKPGPAQYANNAGQAVGCLEHMAKDLALSHLFAADGGEAEIFGGLVPPFSRGEVPARPGSKPAGR